jgi:hypothetical protein
MSKVDGGVVSPANVTLSAFDRKEFVEKAGVFGTVTELVVLVFVCKLWFT